jgi:hypothetical protein
MGVTRSYMSVLQEYRAIRVVVTLVTPLTGDPKPCVSTNPPVLTLTLSTMNLPG